MSEARREKVEAAVKNIETFHEKGVLLLKQRKHAIKSGKVRRETKDGGHTSEKEMNLKACQFADPARGGYSPKKLAKLCKFIRDTQPDQDDDDQRDQNDKLKIFSRTHVVLLLKVRGLRREELQRNAVKHGWSSRDLDREIAASQGTRYEGGRYRPLPDNRAGLLGALEKECERWRRVNLSLNRESSSGQTPLSPDGLIGDLAKCFKVTSVAVRTFQQAVTEALSAIYPDRDRRAAFLPQQKVPAKQVEGRTKTRKKRPK